MDRIIAVARGHPYVTALLVVCIIVVIILLTVGSRTNASIEEHMTGCWVAPDDFCESAEIGSMMIVLDSPVHGWWEKTRRNGYIVILPNGVKSPLTIEYERVRSTGPHECEITARVQFDDGPDWGTEPCKISVDMCRGSMSIVGDRDGTPIVYARLYRNNDISDLVTNIVAEEPGDSAPIADVST